MTGKVTLKIAAHLAPFIRPEASKEDKMRALAGDVASSPVERATMLFFLGHDRDPDVQSAAVNALRRFSEEDLAEVLTCSEVHPRVLDVLARLHDKNLVALALLADRDDLSPGTAAFVEERLQDEIPLACAPSAELDQTEAIANPEEEDIPEETEEFRSKYQLAQIMGTADKIKMALTGDKEWRNILLKDANKLVSGSVVKNPRITEAEILNISKSSIQNDEIVRVICANKEWLKNYQIRKALVENHKTPLPNALRFMTTLTEKDLGFLAKSKNVSTVIATQARRVLLSKHKK